MLLRGIREIISEQGMSLVNVHLSNLMLKLIFGFAIKIQFKHKPMGGYPAAGVHIPDPAMRVNGANKSL